MSWATITNKNQKTFKSSVKEKPVEIKLTPVKKTQQSTYEVFDEYYGDKIYENILDMTYRNKSNILLRNSGSAELYGFFLNYVDIPYHSGPIIEKINMENSVNTYDDYDNY